MSEQDRDVALGLGCTAAEAELWSLIGDFLEHVEQPGGPPPPVGKERRFESAVAAYVVERQAGRASVESLANLLKHIRRHGIGGDAP